MESLYLLVESGPARKACLDYRRALLKAHDAYMEFCESIGVEGYFESILNERPSAFVAPEMIPEGWVVRKRRNGRRVLCPKSKEAKAAVEALPAPPSLDPIQAAIKIKSMYTVERRESGLTEDERFFAGGRISNTFNTISVGWYGKKFILVIPDVNARMKEVREQYKEEPGPLRFSPGRWTPLEGTRVISDAEVKLIEARHKARREKHVKSGSTTP